MADSGLVTIRRAFGLVRGLHSRVEFRRLFADLRRNPVDRGLQRGALVHRTIRGLRGLRQFRANPAGLGRQFRLRGILPVRILGGRVILAERGLDAVSGLLDGRGLAQSIRSGLRGLRHSGRQAGHGLLQLAHALHGRVAARDLAFELLAELGQLRLLTVDGAFNVGDLPGQSVAGAAQPVDLRPHIIHFRLHVLANLFGLRASLFGLLRHLLHGGVDLLHVRILFDRDRNQIGLFGLVTRQHAGRIMRIVIGDRIHVENRADVIAWAHEHARRRQAAPRHDIIHTALTTGENLDIREVGRYAVLQRAIPRHDHALHATGGGQAQRPTGGAQITHPFDDAIGIVRTVGTNPRLRTVRIVSDDGAGSHRETALRLAQRGGSYQQRKGRVIGAQFAMGSHALS